ncbi:molybdenum cofactor guanylyltransferase [Fervidibacillus albus]|uniref:Probable molybdenum cofactor guanylyltransferase n=1 Tax=Fervidibacillus albus TaxID=2980026 RepID=A0A9E8LTH4_9BACI|nr:molybdenum cofactor guanylyltransferase [Fervidibacillus albus]WAA09340.1 molybdenum cofactor guanylyltransferase [Fervidibacillus albus]
MNQFQGVLLAGGQSKRFGSPKAFAKRNGVYFYEYSIDAMQPFCSSITIITSQELLNRFQSDLPNADILTDEKQFERQGPLAGIYTAMENKRSEWYIIAPIDVPFIHASVFKTLISYTNTEVEAIIPTVSEKIQPLTALYHYSLKNHIRNMLKQGHRSVKKMLENRRIVYVPIEENKYFINVNNQKDYYWMMKKMHLK